MSPRHALLGLSLSLVALTALARADDVQGKSPAPDFEGEFVEPHFIEEPFFGPAFVPDFQMTDLPLGQSKAPTSGPHPGSHGGTVIADGRGVLVLDRDAGALIRSDRTGKPLASLAFDPGAGEMVWNGQDQGQGQDRVYVADRINDRVAVVDPGDASGQGLKVIDGVKVREPHGLALTPDGGTLLVTSVAEHELVAIDTATLAVRWRLDVGQEPRAVAVSGDGRQALLGFLSTGAVALVDIGGTSPSATYVALDPAQSSAVDPFSGQAFDDMGMPVATNGEIGRRFARNVFALGYVGEGLAVIPHQLSTPHLPSSGFEDSGTYGGGGGFLAPILHRVAMIDSEQPFAPKTAFAEIGLHQPRALAYDLASDTLFVAGYGDDRVMAIAEVSQSTMHLAWMTGVDTSGAGCAPDGLAFEADKLYVHCELSRQLVTIDVHDASGINPNSGLAVPQAHAGPELASSTRSAAELRGADLFRRGRDHRISTGGFMACASCHPEGRADGLSWRIEGHNLQTPLLSGRLTGTHPFKWDGQDKDLPTSLSNTVGRLGGSGLTPANVADLQAFLEGLPKPKPPSADAAAIARGRELFESEETACAACHEGSTLADGQRHDFGTSLAQVDTPSLIGLAHSAPYYHDGSARTLRALLTDKASVHGMGNTSQLSEDQLGDLIAYLESI